jgi:GNAT superfamily N-acetyltransferase
MQICYLRSNQEYLDRFHNVIEDTESLKFSKHSMNVQNSLYNWQDKPVMAIEENGEIASVLFYNITKSDKYVTILNIVTPEKYRRNGYARILIAEAVRIAFAQGKTRLRMNCDMLPHTVQFYNRLGCVYWGVTKDTALYCNVPLLSNNLDSFKQLASMEPHELLGDDKVKKLIEKRLDLELSKQAYENKWDFVDMGLYRHNEYLDNISVKNTVFSLL